MDDFSCKMFHSVDNARLKGSSVLRKVSVFLHLTLIMSIFKYKYSTASEKPGFILFGANRNFLIYQKMKKIETHHRQESNEGFHAFCAIVLVTFPDDLFVSTNFYRNKVFQ